eukprot:COSAG01_NODE_4176_length_5267_cov_34.739164_7_plen_105_part_00
MTSAPVRSHVTWRRRELHWLTHRCELTGATTHDVEGEGSLWRDHVEEVTIGGEAQATHGSTDGVRAETAQAACIRHTVHGDTVAVACEQQLLRHRVAAASQPRY